MVDQPMINMSSAPQQSNAQSCQDQSDPPKAELIPLVCYICPKNSHFSDLSHLLTHISSKGHLHNMFQLNLSREIDEAADLSLTEFETWYKQNNISALLRARKTAREQRDNNQRQNQTPSVFGEDNTVAARLSNRGGRSSRRGRAAGVSTSDVGYLTFTNLIFKHRKPAPCIEIKERVRSTRMTLLSLSLMTKSKTGTSITLSLICHTTGILAPLIQITRANTLIIPVINSKTTSKMRMIHRSMSRLSCTAPFHLKVHLKRSKTIQAP